MSYAVACKLVLFNGLRTLMKSASWNDHSWSQTCCTLAYSALTSAHECTAVVETIAVMCSGVSYGLRMVELVQYFGDMSCSSVQWSSVLELLDLDLRATILRTRH